MFGRFDRSSINSDWQFWNRPMTYVIIDFRVEQSLHIRLCLSSNFTPNSSNSISISVSICHFIFCSAVSVKKAPNLFLRYVNLRLVNDSESFFFAHCAPKPINNEPQFKQYLAFTGLDVPHLSHTLYSRESSYVV